MTLTRQQRLGIVIGSAVLLALGTAFLPRIAQPREYHIFADQRTQLGVPNAQNVLSNLAFLFVGGWGMAVIARGRAVFAEPIERLPYLIFFAGVALTTFGSGYYHLSPDNARLVWDRLPMTVGFTALVAAIVGERVNLKAGLRLLGVAMLLGFATVFYWIWTENAGRGDLRPYLYVQFFPLIGIPLLIALLPSRYTRGGDIFLVMAAYVVAKLLEGFDAEVFAVTRGVVSGHALKHLAAAFGVCFLVRMLKRREPR
jgi:hypothetical protein